MQFALALSMSTFGLFEAVLVVKDSCLAVNCKAGDIKCGRLEVSSSWFSENLIKSM